MKTLVSISRNVIYRLTALTFFILISSAALLADGETKSTSVDINVNKGGSTGGGMWYNNWWVWAIIVLIFIVIIVAITNRGRKATE